jgi:hypothetical protein
VAVGAGHISLKEISNSVFSQKPAVCVKALNRGFTTQYLARNIPGQNVSAVPLSVLSDRRSKKRCFHPAISTKVDLAALS